MSQFLMALALAIALEGIIYALFPGTVRRFILRVVKISDAELRIGGLTAAVAAVVAIALIRFVAA